MQLKVGDTVVHPSYGVGHIIQIEEKQFSSKEGSRLYYLGSFSTIPKTDVWTLVEADKGRGLRRVTPKSDLDQYRLLLKSRPASPPDDGLQRHTELTERLDEGSFKVMCEIVRDLTSLGNEKSLGATVKDILNKTQERLIQEWAAAADISIAEATEEIDALLQTAGEADPK